MSASLFMAVFDNFSLLKALIAIESSPLFILSQLILIASIVTLMLSLFAFKHIIKPLVIIVLMIAASTTYFMDAYGVIIDSSMIQNVFETDTGEATELLTTKLFIYLLTLGVLPSCFVWRWTLVFKPLQKEIITRLIVIAIALLVIIVPTAISYKHFSIIHRQHKQLRMLANPTYPIYSFIRYIAPRKPSGPVQVVGEDATHIQKSKKSIIVFVLGETARAKQFELNGYSRNTNPKLKNYPIINFNNTWSCGTSTAESVPCMFSLLERKNYNINKARAQESLLDVLKRAGVDVLWRDNNSDCKGACARVGSEDMRKLKDPILCAKSECLDEILLQRLQDYIDNLQQDAFIVLHQKGSHGPEYFKRSPDALKLFTPECTNANIQDCEQQSIINAYDNTILYTDFFLSRVIDLLQKNSTKYNTAMLYMSDHGESLGEKGVYLHGFPYMIAPEEQLHIPFIAWFSQELANTEGLDLECIKASANNKYSHDYIFHTVLGLFSVSTKIYKPELDAFNLCQEK